MPDKIKSRSDLMAEYISMEKERVDFDTEWRKIVNYLMPGYGTFYRYGMLKNYKRKLNNRYIVNNVGTEAQQVLTSGLQAGVTPPNRPWFDLAWSVNQFNTIKEMQVWLEDAKQLLYEALAYSNFYQAVYPFYKELTGFGTSSMYMGSDGDPFRFEPMTIGSYVFSQGVDGRISKLIRIIYLTYRQLHEMFDNDRISDNAKQNYSTNPEFFTPVIHGVIPQPIMDKPFTSVYYELAGGDDEQYLRKSGFYEFPFLSSRWDVIGSDNYGLGPGSVALPDIQRIQELEKSFLMSAHKNVNPPLNAPARKRGQVKTLPGGINYYDNPNEVVTSMYNVNIDYTGVGNALERTEARVKKVFFNDIFLTASRDPNLSPLKATEVRVREDEKMLRLGPVVERAQYEFLSPLIERGVNILLRKGVIPPIPQQYLEMMAQQGATNPLSIRFVSVLTQGQKMFGIQPIQTFLGLSSGVAQFNPQVLDKIDSDAIVDEVADMSGVSKVILRSAEEVKQIRDARAQQQAREAEKQQALEQAAAQGAGLSQQQQQADIAKTYSDAGVNLQEVLGSA